MPLLIKRDISTYNNRMVVSVTVSRENEVGRVRRLARFDPKSLPNARASPNL